MTIVPAGPSDELLVRLLQEIEEEFRRHVFEKDSLQK